VRDLEALARRGRHCVFAKPFDAARKHAEDALTRRDMVLQAIGFAAGRFLKSADWAAALPDVATFSSVDTEKVVEAGADLVVGGLGFTPAEAITKLRSLGIPVLVVYAPSVDGVLKDIELLGTAVGEPEKATEITDAMRADMKLTTDAAAAEATKAGTKPRVFYEIGYTDATGEIFAPADASFLAEMVTLAGAERYIASEDAARYRDGLGVALPPGLPAGLPGGFAPLAAAPARSGAAPSRSPPPIPCREPSICMTLATISVVYLSWPSLSCHLRVCSRPST